jgi:hypothetical protein
MLLKTGCKTRFSSTDSRRGSFWESVSSFEDEETFVGFQEGQSVDYVSKNWVLAVGVDYIEQFFARPNLSQ